MGARKSLHEQSQRAGQNGLQTLASSPCLCRDSIRGFGGTLGSPDVGQGSPCPEILVDNTDSDTFDVFALLIGKCESTYQEISSGEN